MTNHWIAVAEEYPDFRLYGFHTGNKVEVRFADGLEEVVVYHGFGVFGNDNREDVTHWRTNEITERAKPQSTDN